MAYFTVDGISSGYGSGLVIRDISFEMEQGEILGCIGRNGMGKSTLMKTLMGLLPRREGRIHFKDQDITNRPTHELVPMGLGYVPQGRDVFPKLSVLENLKITSFQSSPEKRDKYFDLVYEYFPVLRDRSSQWAGTLSGGEQQMLAIGRALLGGPELLLIDEPSEGLQPSLVKQISRDLAVLNENEGITILIVEQNLDMLRGLVHSSLVIENGEIATHLDREELSQREQVKKYLGM